MFYKKENFIFFIALIIIIFCRIINAYEIPVIENGIEKTKNIPTPLIIIEGYREFRDYPEEEEGRYGNHENFGLRGAENLTPWLLKHGVPAYQPYYDNQPEFGSDEYLCRLKYSFSLIGVKSFFSCKNYLS